MKAVYCGLVAILFSVCGLCNDLKIRSLDSFSCVSYSQLDSGKSAVVSKSEMVGSNQSSKEFPGKNKKRNRKGVKPLLFCLLNAEKGHFEIGSYRSSYFQQIIYFFQSFSGNGERGPPFALSKIA